MVNPGQFIASAVLYFKKMKKINKFLRKNLPVARNWFKLESREMTFVNSLAVLAD